MDHSSLGWRRTNEVESNKGGEEEWQQEKEKNRKRENEGFVGTRGGGVREGAGGLTNREALTTCQTGQTPGALNAHGPLLLGVWGLEFTGVPRS